MTKKPKDDGAPKKKEGERHGAEYGLSTEIHSVRKSTSNQTTKTIPPRKADEDEYKDEHEIHSIG